MLRKRLRPMLAAMLGKVAIKRKMTLPLTFSSAVLSSTVLIGVVLVGAVLAVVGTVLLPSTSAHAHTPPHAKTTNLDDFEFESFDAQYFLGRDADGHSTLRTVETLVAVFPEIDQNRGIRRLLTERYQGHPTDLTIVSVTDGQGNELPYEDDSDDDILTLTIRGDEYLHGAHTYVIEYEQRNVTHFFSDTNRDEFYWDVNGLDWGQPFASVTATVHLEDGLSEALTGHVSAVQGGDGATAPATITEASDGSSLGFASAAPLAAHETLTFAIGFAPGTFTPRADGFFASPAPAISAGAVLVNLGSAVWAFIVRRRYLRDAPGRGIIVPEYEPLDRVSVLTAANIVGDALGHAVPAQIIDLAVRGHVRLLERSADGTKPGKLKKPGYLVELIAPTTITDEHEYKLVKALFGADPLPGSVRDLAKPDGAVSKALLKLQQRVASDAVTNGLRASYPSKPVTWLVSIACIAALAGIISGALALDQAVGGTIPIFTLLAVIVGLIVAIVLVSRRPLEARGVQIRDHLRGQKMYIKLAEADRLRYLQSPEGALRVSVERSVERSAERGAEVGVDATDADAPGAGATRADPTSAASLDAARVVHLYERLLPYAMLFGEEKKWVAELGRMYETSGDSPSWYYGATAFSASSFSASFNSMSTSLAGAYSASSSGGSSGASAGGGGGGGGGGGA